MQVAVDGRSLVGPRTGIGVYAAGILREWVAAGHDVTVLVARAADVSAARSAIADPRADRSRVVAVGRPFHLRAALFARRAGSRYWSPDSLIVPVLLGRGATATVHDLAPLLHPTTHTLRVRLAYRLLSRAAVRRARAVLTPSESTRADLLRRHPSANVVVTGAGPRSGPMHPVHDSVTPRMSHVEAAYPSTRGVPGGVRPPYLLFVGALEPRKHPAELAEAFHAAAPADWQLVVAGPTRWLSSADIARLRGLALVDERIRLLGHVDDPTLDALLAGATALAYPSSYEGFGLPVLEAMAAGVPVLTTSAGALAELAGDAALLVDLAGPDPYGAGLEAAIARITGDAGLRDRLAAAGRERAAGHDWARAATAAWAAVTS